MHKYNEKQLEENYNKFIEAIKKSFEGERLEKLLHMYSMDELGPNLLVSPASGNVNYHNSYEGGYIDHILNVARNSLRMMKIFQEAGGKVDFTQEELLFAAFHHDLGKLGEKGLLHYHKNKSDWHIKNQGKYFETNPDIWYLSHTDRTMYLLSEYELKYTKKEYFGMRLADGMYDEDNKKYLKTYNPNSQQRTPIGYILHWADSMSTCIERQNPVKI